MYRLAALILTICILLAGCLSPSERPDNTSVTSSETTIKDATEPNATGGNTTTESTASDTDTTEHVTTESVTTDIETTAPNDFPPEIAQSGISDAMLSLYAQNAFVYNSTDGVLLGMKGDGVNIVPASITKLLTALYALHTVPDDLVITATSDALSLVGKNSSIAYIKKDFRLSVSQLIQGMMMPSGNDAAYVLAVGVGRYISNDPSMSANDAVDLFMSNLNSYAKSIGCTGTHYSVPDGLARENHYTSTHDLIIVGKLASEHPLISKYANTVSEKVYYKSGQNITWNNSNYLINPNSEYYSPYVNGLKTGSLSGNNCIYVSAVINEKTYLIGIFGCSKKNDRYDDAHLLINAILESTKEAGD